MILLYHIAIFVPAKKCALNILGILGKRHFSKVRKYAVSDTQKIFLLFFATIFAVRYHSVCCFLAPISGLFLPESAENGLRDPAADHDAVALCHDRRGAVQRKETGFGKLLAEPDAGRIEPVAVLFGIELTQIGDVIQILDEMEVGAALLFCFLLFYFPF